MQTETRFATGPTTSTACRSLVLEDAARAGQAVLRRQGPRVRLREAEDRSSGADRRKSNRGPKSNGSLDKCMGHSTWDIRRLTVRATVLTVNCHMSHVECPMHLSNDQLTNRDTFPPACTPFKPHFTFVFKK
jgi:hypothetical protein